MNSRITSMNDFVAWVTPQPQRIVTPCSTFLRAMDEGAAERQSRTNCSQLFSARELMAVSC
jgi:hypothetical protein